MKTNGSVAPYTLLLIPLLLGCAAIWLVHSSAPESNPEGDALGRFFFGWAVTLLLPLLVVMIANWALPKRRIPYPAFFAVVLLALGPVAYFQCASVPPSLPLAYLSHGMNYAEFLRAFPRLVTEALAGFCSVVAVLSYGLYRFVR